VCGIAGIVRYGGIDEGDAGAVASMERLLAHRGPDGSGRYRDPWCVLAQTRLAVIGTQPYALPMRSMDGRYAIAYNGEVYNFEELRRELGDMPFATSTDTEVVLAAWIRWGPRALDRLNGMFAFFVWDSVERRGFAACDRIGVKPFLYSHEGGRFCFASETAALVESRAVRFAPDEDAIAEHLTAPYFTGAARLPFAGIHRLPPASWLELTPEGVRTGEYFRFHFARGGDAPPLSDALEGAVWRSLRADAPLGVFLSGGVDSSVVAAIAQRHSTEPVPAWTIS
jgi:asparagine synthase (glutamine-hydrolysing)